MANRYCNGMIHVVKQGDTLYQISRTYQVPLGLVLQANPYVDVYNLSIGQEICIPGRPGMPERPVMPRNDDNDDDDNRERIVYVTDGEISLGDLLREYRVDWEDFAEMNDLSQILLAKDVMLYLPRKV